jgi:hypothetical protein
MTLASEVNKLSIQHCLLIDLEINSTTTYYLSNHYQPLTYNGNNYQQMGYFLQMSEMQNDINPSNNQIQVGLAGIPSDVIPNFPSIALNTNIKGSKIKIYRAFFNNYDLDSAYLRFSGYVSNYSLSETWDDESRMTNFSITLQCSNILAIIERQFTGRRTNEKDQKIAILNNGTINSTDTSFDRIKRLADSSFDFGKKN